MGTLKNLDPQPDAVAWAHAQTIAFSKRKLRIYGLLILTNLITFVLLLRGMPAHALWPYLGPLLGISLVCPTAVTMFYGVALLGEKIDWHRRK